MTVRVRSHPVGLAAADVAPLGRDALQLIADNAPVAVWATGLDGRVIFVNRRYAEFLGLSRREALSFDLRSILHADDAQTVRRKVIVGEASGKPFELIARHRRGDGEWRWLHSTVQPRRDGDGTIIGFIGVAHDVTATKDAEMAVRDREAQFSAFINQSTAGFAQVDLEGRFTLVNARFCEIAGWPEEELIGRTMQSITHPADLPRNLHMFERAVAVGAPYTHEKRYIRKGGGIVWVNNSVSVIRRPNGEPFGVLAVTIDVTQRRNAEEELRRSEETLRLATESAGMATWELDLASTAGRWSANRFDLFGLPRAPDLRGTVEQWLERVVDEDRELVREAAERCFRTGEPYRIEYRIRRADTGEQRWLESHGNRIDYAGVPASRFVGVSFDITERKVAEGELRDSEERYRTIFEQANDYLITTTIDQRIVSVNPAALSALGYSEEEAIGRPVSDFMDAEQFLISRAALDRKIAEGGNTRLPLVVRTRDGRELVWEIDSRLTLDKHGAPNGLHAIGRDITEARRAEAHQRLLIDELNHRVKNTLAIVQGIAQQTFSRTADPDRARRAFEGRLSALSEAHDLLTRGNWGPVSMMRIIHDAVAPHAGEGRFVLGGPDLTVAPKTAISLALAIHELATNAVKHGALSNARGQVVIEWARGGTEAEPRLALSWTERGGPPVTAPRTRGFGTRMIERGLAAELNGSVTIAFEPDGLTCAVDAPLPEVRA